MMSKQFMEDDSQAVDVGSGVGLCLSVLLWGRIAGSAHDACVFGLAVLEETCDAEVNELQDARASDHDVGGFQVPEDDRWGLAVEVGEDVT
jgi:hypothetical protein